MARPGVREAEENGSLLYLALADLLHRAVLDSILLGTSYEVQDGSAVMSGLRLVKDHDEIRRLKRAVEINTRTASWRAHMVGFRSCDCSAIRTGQWGGVGLAALFVAGMLAVHPCVASAQDRYAEVVEGILAEWKHADLICLGEAHGREYDSELRIALVRHPAFATTVRLIVVESANPIHQDLLDQFVLQGVSMTREELAPIWRDANAAEVWESPIYEAFLRAVREVNLPLPIEQRIRVLGGDSEIDWSQVTRAEELVSLVHRNRNVQDIIARQVLDRHVKALAIYGKRHCSKVEGGFPGELESRYGKERIWSIWPLEAKNEVKIARTVFGLGNEPGYVVITGSEWAPTPATGMDAFDPRFTMGEVANGVVYHGSVPDSVVPADLSVFRAKYGAELERRRRLLIDAFKLWESRNGGKKGASGRSYR